MGIRVLWEDDTLWAVLKPAGALSEDGQGANMPALIRETTGASYIGTVHRLDKEAAGVMVYAKTPAAAAFLSSLVAGRQMEKDYLAVVHGRPEADIGEYRDYLFRDKNRGKSFVVNRPRRGVKEAVLRYQLLASADGLSLVRIRLETGRTHQIRVQFSSRRMPLYGDRRYGGREPDGLALWSCRIAFTDGKGERRTFSAWPEGGVWERFKDVIASADNKERKMKNE